MSPTFIAAAGIVIAASIAFVVIGNIYKWDIASASYAKWTRVAGVVAVLALSAVTAWDRIERPVEAVGALVAGAALSVGYVLVHRRLTRQICEALKGPESGA